MTRTAATCPDRRDLTRPASHTDNSKKREAQPAAAERQREG